MIKVTRPTNLNGAELMDELNAASVKITEPPMLDGNGELWLDIAGADTAKAEAVLAKHNGTQIAPEPTVAQKLHSVGLTLDELKVALGL
jgi:Ser/Thr protein kinase RdoA (MazF antagonist)